MLHVFFFSVSVNRESYKKSILHFDAFQLLDFFFCDTYEVVFLFLEKLQDVFVAFRHPHFPHAKPIIKFVSRYFKPKTYLGSYGLWQTLLLGIFTIKHFKNVSGKIRSGHRFYSDGAFLQLINNSRSLLQNYAHTRRRGGGGAFWLTLKNVNPHRAMRGAG